MSFFFFLLYRGGDLPLDLQWVPSLPVHGSATLCLPEDGEPVHLQSGSSGRRKLLLLCFQPHHREECLLQVHPPHPLTTWWRLDEKETPLHKNILKNTIFCFSSVTSGYLFLFLASGERKYPADIRVKFPDTTAMLASNITLECFALGK